MHLPKPLTAQARSPERTDYLPENRTDAVRKRVKPSNAAAPQTTSSCTNDIRNDR